jgi:hypothetical protein
MFSNFLFQRIVVIATSIIEVFVYKSGPVLPFYNTEIDYNNYNNYNNSIGKKCLDADMDSVFFV